LQTIHQQEYQGYLHQILIKVRLNTHHSLSISNQNSKDFTLKSEIMETLYSLLSNETETEPIYNILCAIGTLTYNDDKMKKEIKKHDKFIQKKTEATIEKINKCANQIRDLYK
jgi:hypothetical protein